MKKATILNYLLVGYQASMDRKEYDEFKNQLVQYEKELKPENAELLAGGILKDFPQFQIMHEAYVRSRLDKISSNISVVKTIMIIYLICTILGAIIIAAQIK